MSDQTLHTYFAVDVEHPGQIQFDEHQPLFHTEQQKEHLYDITANLIAHCLLVNCPQGVFERVVVEMALLMVTNYQTSREVG